MSHDDPMDDPRLTAHAMGEAAGPLTPEEQAEVDAIRATADALCAGFAATPMPTLDPAHRAAILQGLSPEAAKPNPGTVPGSALRLSEYSGLGALAATLLLVIGFGIAGAAGGGIGGSAGSSNLYVKTFSAPNYSGLYVVDADVDGAIAGSTGDRTYASWKGAVGYGGTAGGIQPTPNAFYTKGVGGGGGGAGGSPGSQAWENSKSGGAGGAIPLKSAGQLGGGGGGGGHQYSGEAGRMSLESDWRRIKARGDRAMALPALGDKPVSRLANGRGERKSGAGSAGDGKELRGYDKFTVGSGVSPQTIYLPRSNGALPDTPPTPADTAGGESDGGGGESASVGGVVNQADEEMDFFAADDTASTESYLAILENPWIRPVGEAALSTFSIDVDTAGYSIVRRCLVEQNRLPPPGALRVEELVNYFPYAYDGPVSADPFAVHVDAAACPWAPSHRLVRIALKGREFEEAQRPAANLVFLLDVSGSMAQPNKLPLVKKSIEMLTDRLTARDRVAMVVYAGNSGLVLPSTPAGDHAAILSALERLEAGGSTNGGAGIELAYKVAAENFVSGGINRVVLATDGDFNVGVSDPSSLVKMVEEKAKTGVFLTALGYGMDNLKDSTLEQLADRGNGNYGYVDNLGEARKVLVEQGMSTLHCIAKDVKIQVEFNPAKVAGYRLLGYENRMLAAQDFADDQKDAGEIGAGHTVTALYEVVPAGVEVPGAPVDELRYQRPGSFSGNAETLVVKLRWKEPEGAVSTPREFPFVDAGLSFESASPDFRFAAGVAAFGMVLRDSKQAGSANLDLVREIAAGALGADAGGYRAEFVTLVDKAKSLKK